MNEILERLTYLPHRGSATAEASSARQRLATYLKAKGFGVKHQAFSAPRTNGWELFGISLALAVGGLIPNGFVALVGFYAFWAYFSGWPLPWARFANRYPTENLIAQAGEGRRTLVLMAHVDTAKTFYLYDPNLVKSFRANFLFTAAVAFASVPLAFFWLPGARLAGLYFLIQSGLLLWRERRAAYVNGANDNASGVAVATQLFLDLAPHLMHEWQLMLVLTGAEEVGARGAQALLKSGLVPEKAHILNIDNVGRGRLHYATGEGMLEYQTYKGRLLEEARKLPGAEPVAYRLAYFDTLPFARAGYPCLTLLRLDGSVPADWHWPTDTPERIDLEALAGTYAYARTLLERAGVVLHASVEHF